MVLFWFSGERLIYWCNFGDTHIWDYSVDICLPFIYSRVRGSSCAGVFDDILGQWIGVVSVQSIMCICRSEPLK